MPITFEEICKIEPRLRVLHDSVTRRMEDDGDFWIKWSRIKADMCKLVGFGSQAPELGGCAEYDTAYSTLYAAAEAAQDAFDRSKEAQHAE